jgi:hypothetical protein
MRFIGMTGAVVAFAAAMAGGVHAQSFSCSFGEPACLDYGAVVCKSSAICVCKDAICFDSYTCDYNGFVCKSQFNEAVAEIDEKIRRHNLLVAEYNELNERHARVTAELESLRNDKRSADSCVESASTLEEAQFCRQ